MYRHILVASDGSELSSRAIEGALRLAHALRAKVTVLTVIEPLRAISIDSERIDRTRADYERFAAEQAWLHLAEAEHRARQIGISCEVEQIKGQNPYEAIIATAAAKSCDLIAMASHGRSGASAMLMGSQTAKVLAHSRIPVLVYR